MHIHNLTVIKSPFGGPVSSAPVLVTRQSKSLCGNGYFYFFLAIYLGVEFLGPLVTVFSFFKNFEALFFKTDIPFHIATGNKEAF